MIIDCQAANYNHLILVNSVFSLYARVVYLGIAKNSITVNSQVRRCDLFKQMERVVS